MNKQAEAQKPLNIILLGDPAAGKATQSQLLVKRYKLYDFDMGKELTVLRLKDSRISKILQRNYDQGKLTPTAIVRKILRDTITSIPKNRGILFDGHPKMLGEAKIAVSMLKKLARKEPLVIYLSIPLNVTVSRMHDRKGYFKGKFGKRSDDSDSALKNRVRYYRKNITEVVEFFNSKYPFKKISGLGTVAQVEARISKEVEKFLKSKKS